MLKGGREREKEEELHIKFTARSREHTHTREGGREREGRRRNAEVGDKKMGGMGEETKEGDNKDWET